MGYPNYYFPIIQEDNAMTIFHDPGLGDTTATYERVVCPECGQTVSAEYGAKHARSHWPDYIDPNPLHAEAIKRQKILVDATIAFRDAHPEGKG